MENEDESLAQASNGVSTTFQKHMTHREIGYGVDG